MSDPNTAQSRRHHPVASAVAALVLGMVGTALAVVTAVESALFTQAQAERSTQVISYAGPAATLGLEQAAAVFIPLTVAVFVSFWIIAPLRAHQGILGALGRILVAMAIGSIVACVVGAVRIVGQDFVALHPVSGVVGTKTYLLLAGTIVDQCWRIISTALPLTLAAGLGLWGHLARAQTAAAAAPAPAPAPAPTILGENLETATPQYLRAGE